MAENAEMTLAEKKAMLLKLIEGRDACVNAIGILCASIRSDEETKTVQQIQEIESTSDREEQWLASQACVRVC
jgi:hypothetical protein